MTWGFMGIFKRALQFPDGVMVAVSPPGTARLRYNDTTKAIEASIDGAAYAAFGNPSDIPIADNDATAFDVHQGANSYIVISTLNGTEAITLGNLTTNPAITMQSRAFTFTLLDNAAAALSIAEAANAYLSISTANGSEAMTIGPAAINPTVAIATRALSVDLVDNVAVAVDISEGANAYLLISTANGVETISMGNATTNPGINLLGLSAKTVNGWLALGENAADPATTGNRVLVYTKDVAGVSELFTRDDGGNILQVTSAGELAARSIPVVDNTAVAFQVHEAANAHILLNTTNGAEILTLGAAVATTAVRIAHASGALGFYGNAGAAKQTVTGAKGGNAALTSLMAALVAIGLFTDTTT